MSCGRQAPGAQFSFREVEDDHARETHLFPGRAGPEEGHRCGLRRSRSPAMTVLVCSVPVRASKETPYGVTTNVPWRTSRGQLSQVAERLSEKEQEL